MSQSTTLDARGVHTYASDLSGVPLGSFKVALNVNINRAGIVEPRPGFNFLDYALPSEDDRHSKLLFWNEEIFAHYGDSFAIYDESTGYSSRGSLTAPNDATSIRSVSSSNKNLYVTSDTGLKKTDAVTTSLYQAGIPKGLTIDLSLSGAGTAVQNSQYATYTYVLGRKDANGNIQYGGVAGNFIFQNTAGSTQDIDAKCYLPSGLDTSYFIQLYRSETSATTPPPNGPQLCNETPLTSTHISQGYVTITDVQPDALLAGTVYTAASEFGIAEDNLEPPLARDIVEFKGYMFYADVEYKHSLVFTLISGSLLVAGETITLTRGATTEVYTAHASTFNAATKQFITTTGGSPAQNIDATIKSFIKCVNLGSDLYYAYAVPESPLNPLPGQVILRAKDFHEDAFTAISSEPTAFQPQLEATPNVNTTSTAKIAKNGLAFSRANNLEAVPTKNIFYIGSADDRIKRIVALRESLFIFKERGGVYVLTGEGETTFTDRLLDDTAKLVAPDSLAVVNNLAYGLFEGGICKVSDTGVTILSIPVKDQILPLYGAPLTKLKTLSFGWGNDVDAKYILSVPTLATSGFTEKQFVLDTFSERFCFWNLPITCGAVNPINTKTYLGQGESPYLRVERKQFDHTDYGDYVATCTVTAASGATVTINNTLGMARGDIIYQGEGAFAYIESIDTFAGTVEIDAEQDWTLDTADVTHVAAIDCKIQWNPDFGGNAAGLKHYYEAVLIMKQGFQKEASIYFSSDINPSEASISVTAPSGNGAFGTFDFGEETFGGDQSTAPKRVGIPRGHARCSQLSVRFENKVAFSDFQLTGLSLSFQPTSTRTTR